MTYQHRQSTTRSARIRGQGDGVPHPAGTKLGRYEIRSHIGAGGMGDVYLARDTELDRSVALKVSRDGKRLAVSRGYSNLDVVLIKDFR